MIRSLFACFVATMASLPAQVIDTVGGMASAPVGANRAKGSLYAVNTTVVLTEFETYLDVPAQETLTFFMYRHHSRTGTSTLELTLPVTVPGGIGPAWYSTGPITWPMVAGNHYVLGVAWQGSITYYYSTATSGSPVSFGNWQRAHTLTNPVPTTLVLPAGTDIAQYYQRLTSVPTTSVVNTGTGCSATPLVPRLVASSFFTLGATTNLQLVDAAQPSVGLFALANGGPAAVPVPLFGCSIWLDLSGPIPTLAALTAAGQADLPITVPNNPVLVGTTYSAQGLVFGTAIDVANAVSFTIN